MGKVDGHRDAQRPSEPAAGLVLARDVIIGHQVANLLSSARGWLMQVADQDRHAYAHISRCRPHAVVADIDSSDLGGLPFLIYARRHWPSVIGYAITCNENAHVKQLACDMAACDGFFYLSAGGLMLDMHAGMASRLAEEIPAGDVTARPEEGE